MKTMCETGKRQKKKRIGWLLTGLAALTFAGCANVQPVNKPVFARGYFAGEKDNDGVLPEQHSSKTLVILGLHRKTTLLEKIILLSR